MAETVVFSYDGGTSVVAYISDADIGQAYTLAFIDDGDAFYTRTATGHLLTLRAIISDVLPGSTFTAAVYKPPTLDPIATEDFVKGTPSVETPSTVPEGIVVALDDAPLEPDPVWTRLDDPAQTWRVTGWETAAGRSSELNKTEPGTYSVTIIDRDGSLDATNPTSDIAAKLVPGKQFGITLQDASGDWHWRFRGWIDEVLVDIEPTTRLSTVTLELVDAFTYWSRVEMMPGVFGDPVPAGSEGDIYFAETAADDPLLVSSRMHDVADTIGFPVGWRRFFTGNVRLQATVYERRDQALTVLEDAADAEFPDVSNLFPGKDGLLTFHGRLARFTPETYKAASDLTRSGGASICFWSAISGDLVADFPDVAVIRGNLGYRISANDVINDALALPQNVDEADVPDGWTHDDVSKGVYGWRTVTYPDLLVLAGPGGSTAVEECKKYADYHVDNYGVPRIRIQQLRFLSTDRPADQAIICGLDLGDVITVTTHHWPDGEGGFAGGFAEDYFAERIQQHATVGPDGISFVEMIVDVSPRAFYDVSPFA